MREWEWWEIAKRIFLNWQEKRFLNYFQTNEIGFWLKIDNWRRVHLWRLATQISGLPRLKSKRLRDAITCGKRYIVLGRKFSSAAVKRASLMMEKIENILCIEFTNAFLPNASRMKMSLNFLEPFWTEMNQIWLTVITQVIHKIHFNVTRFCNVKFSH